MSDSINRILSFNKNLDGVFRQTVKDRVLQCQTCGRIEEAKALYWREGWPVCHGETMRLRTIKVELTDDVIGEGQ